MSFELTGRILEISPVQQVSEKFRKREFVIEYTENQQYPEYIKLELVQDKCNLLDNLKTGQEVAVMFNLKGRKWTDAKGEVKYFNSLQAWKINAAGSENTTTPDRIKTPQAAKPAADWAANGEDSDNDLPF